MGLHTQSRTIELDQELVDEQFARIARYTLEEQTAPHIGRHAVDQPTIQLPFVPRSNRVPPPRLPADDVPPPPLDPEDKVPETRRPGRHRAPRQSVMKWIGGSTMRTLTVTMLSGSLALSSGGSLLEDSLEKQTTYNYTLEEPAIVFPNIPSQIDQQPQVKPATPPKTLQPKPHTSPKPTAPPNKPAPTTAPKKPTVATAEHWPAPGTNCDYIPKHEHKASETSPAQAMAIGEKMITACFGTKQWFAAKDLLRRESNWRPMAINPKSKACGIPQAWRCIRLLRASKANSLGNTTVERQVHWFIEYVIERYGTPVKARSFWLSRKPVNGRDMGHWY